MTLEQELIRIRKELKDLCLENKDTADEKYMKEIMGSILKLNKALFYLKGE